MHRSIAAIIAALAGIPAIPAVGWSQHEHMKPTPRDSAPGRDSMPPAGGTMQGVLGIPESRTGSGTSWLPDAAPMHAYHVMARSWSLMIHGVAFGIYDRQFDRRGDEQINSTNWGMVMATRPFAGGQLQLRGMFSAEPFTVGSEGYPLLLQTGESFKGQPLHDRQHPHDLFMELAALYERPVAKNLAFSLYLAPVGEPALGPVAYPHRPSASADPFAPISHHWQDATHISFGVITAGLFSRTMKLEGSLFNGREPNEDRYDFDYRGRSLDSYAGRLTVNPNPHWSLSVSWGFLKSPEELQPNESTHRASASVLYSGSLGMTGSWSGAVIYGVNTHPGTDPSNSITAETSLDPDPRNSLFGRVEYVNKTAEDLVLSGVPDDRRFNLSNIVLGYVRKLVRTSGLEIGIGVRGAVTFVPVTLEDVYGSRTPLGLAAYLRVRPIARTMGHEMEMMPGHPMSSAAGEGGGHELATTSQLAPGHRPPVTGGIRAGGALRFACTGDPFCPLARCRNAALAHRICRRGSGTGHRIPGVQPGGAFRAGARGNEAASQPGAGNPGGVDRRWNLALATPLFPAGLCRRPARRDCPGHRGVCRWRAGLSPCY